MTSFVRSLDRMRDLRRQAVVNRQRGGRAPAPSLRNSSMKLPRRKQERPSVVTAFHIESESVELFFINVKIASASSWLVYQVMDNRTLNSMNPQPQVVNTTHKDSR